MSPQSVMLMPRRFVSAHLGRLLRVVIFALLCGGQASSETITIRDVQDTDPAGKVQGRVRERIGAGEASGIECVDTGRLLTKKEVLAGVFGGILTTALVVLPEPEERRTEESFNEPVPEPSAVLLLATGLGYVAARLRKRGGARRRSTR